MSECKVGEQRGVGSGSQMGNQGSIHFGRSRLRVRAICDVGRLGVGIVLYCIVRLNLRSGKVEQRPEKDTSRDRERDQRLEATTTLNTDSITNGVQLEAEGARGRNGNSRVKSQAFCAIRLG